MASPIISMHLPTGFIRCSCNCILKNNPAKKAQFPNVRTIATLAKTVITPSLHRIIRPGSTTNSYITPRRLLSQYLEGQLPPGTKKEPPWRTLFFGTDEFALAHLKALHENRVGGDKKIIDTLDVVIPKGGKGAVSKFSQKYNIHTYEWPLSSLHGMYDVGVVVSFGHLIPERVIQMFPYGILNVHPSLLPRWRGASPILHTVLNGDTHTGISIMEIRPIHFDIGPLLVQVQYPVHPDCTGEQLSTFLADEGSGLLLETLYNLPTLERFEHEQDEIGVTYAHKLTVTNARVNWMMQSMSEIHRQSRALAHMFDLRSEWMGQHVRLLNLVSPHQIQELCILQSIEEVFPEDQVCPRPGIPYYLKDHQLLCIRCKDGWVAFRNIVMKKTMSAKAFYNGYLTKPQNKGFTFKSLPNELDKYTFRTAAAQMKLAAVMR